MRFAMMAAAAACVMAVPASAQIANISFEGWGTNRTGDLIFIRGLFTFSDGSAEPVLPSDYTGEIRFQQTSAFNPGINSFFVEGFGSSYDRRNFSAGGIATFVDGKMTRFGIGAHISPEGWSLSNRYWSYYDRGFVTGGEWRSDTYPFLATIPEPATWALMILGFGAVGGAMRKRARGVLAHA